MRMRDKRAAWTVLAAAFLALPATACVLGANPATAEQQPQTVSAQPAAPAAESAATPADLSHSKALFEGVCSGCHAIGLVTSKGHDRDGWVEVVTRMYGLGMEASQDEALAIVDYLAATHPAK